jgi:hypothetical protein
LQIYRGKGIYFLKKVIPVGVKGEKRIIEVPLKNTVRAIHRAIRDGIDHIVAAADMSGSPWAGLKALSIEMGEKKNLFPNPNGILN